MYVGDIKVMNLESRKWGSRIKLEPSRISLRGVFMVGVCGGMIIGDPVIPIS